MSLSLVDKVNTFVFSIFMSLWVKSTIYGRSSGSLGAPHGLLSLAKECIIQLTFVFQLSRRASLNFTLKFFSASSSDLPKAKESFKKEKKQKQND